MGELHLEIIVDRLRREFGVDANVGRPQVAYRETIRRRVEQESRFVRQTGGRGQYGHVFLRIEPTEAGTGFEFADEVVGGVIPREYVPAVRRGVEEQMKNGILAGYPVVDVRVTLYDGSHHEVDSSEVAFRVAGTNAFRDGTRRASPVILEPMMKVDVVTPDEHLGDVMGDISRRRGTVQGMEESASGQVIRSEVPLAEMFGYATDLRSLTQGRATFNMEFRRYLRSAGPGGGSHHPAQVLVGSGEIRVGQGEVRAHEAARERRHDRSRGSRQDDADGGDHAGDGGASRG